MSDIDYNKYLRYDPTTGEFFRKGRMGRWPAGSKSGSALANGHIAVSLFGNVVSGRRLAWYMHYGEWPEREVLSLNGKKDDLRIENLALPGSGVELTQAQLLGYCEYADGRLYRRNPVKGFLPAPIGSLCKSGYLETSVLGKRFLVHRLVWFYHFGTWPELLDHINGDRVDNRIENLRAADFLQNSWNTQVTKDRQLPRGVDMPHGRSQTGLPYRMRMKYKGRVYREYFSTPEAASAAYETLKRTLCGDWSPV